MTRRSFIPTSDILERRNPTAVDIAIVPAMIAGLSPASEDRRVPLDELTGTYQGRSGGLYGQNSNEPWVELANAAEEASSRIVPLDASGTPNANGKIGLLAIGQSTTRMVFADFQKSSRSVRSQYVVPVNGALDGATAEAWGRTSGPWSFVNRKLRAVGLNPKQVQVIWIETTLLKPARYGEFPNHADSLADELRRIANIAERRFPNLRMVYFSSRYSASFAKTESCPEPYAYETAFGIRDFLLSRNPGGSDPDAQPSSSIAMWGPYYWTDGSNPSTVDGLVMERRDFLRDGVHPSLTGRAKVGAQIFQFFSHDKLAQGWFLGQP